MNLIHIYLNPSTRVLYSMYLVLGLSGRYDESSALKWLLFQLSFSPFSLSLALSLTVSRLSITHYRNQEILLLSPSYSSSASPLLHHLLPHLTRALDFRCCCFCCCCCLCCTPIFYSKLMTANSRERTKIIQTLVGDSAVVRTGEKGASLRGVWGAATAAVRCNAMGVHDLAVLLFLNMYTQKKKKTKNEIKNECIVCICSIRYKV